MILLCHGVGTTRNDVLERSVFLAKSGYPCFLFDWRGHGESDRHRIGYGLFETPDLKAALLWIQTHYPGRKIGVLALSMGAAINIQSAKDCPEVSAYVLDSPFTTLWEMARESFKWMPSPLLSPFQTLLAFWGSLFAGRSIMDVSPENNIQGLLPRPILLIHGDSDNYIPSEHSQRFYAKYAGKKEIWLAPNVPHGWAHLLHPHEYESRVVAFFSRTLTSEGAH